MSEVIYNKFLVLKNEDIKKYLSVEEIIQLNKIDDKIYTSRVADNKKGGNAYYVVNQDEPYAEEVLQLILEGEDKKQGRINCEVADDINKKCSCYSLKSMNSGLKCSNCGREL